MPIHSAGWNCDLPPNNRPPDACHVPVDCTRDAARLFVWREVQAQGVENIHTRSLKVVSACVSVACGSEVSLDRSDTLRGGCSLHSEDYERPAENIQSQLSVPKGEEARVLAVAADPAVAAVGLMNREIMGQSEDLEIYCRTQ